MAIALNALCPCGSGKKYKRCCYVVDSEASVDRKAGLPKIIVGVSLVAGVGAYLYTNDLRTGVLIAIGGCMVALAIISFTDPPPPKAGSGDPAGMNFGR